MKRFRNYIHSFLRVSKVQFSKNYKIRPSNIGFYVIFCFFGLTLIARIFSLWGYDLKIPQLMAYSIAITGFYSLFKINFKLFDFVIICYLFILLSSALLSTKQHYSSYFYWACLYKIIPISAFFIGRRGIITVDFIIENMKIPIFISMVCGLYFYFMEPGWYLAMKLEQINELTDESHIMEVYRLSSFWGHPYAVAYATTLYFFYTIKISLSSKLKTNRKFYIISIFLCVTTLIFANLRVTLVVSIFVLFYMSLIYTNKQNVIKISFYGILLSVIIYLFVFNLSNTDQSGYIIGHMQDLFVDDAVSDRFEHTQGDIRNISLIGDGVGYYGYKAREFGRWAIVDQEFQNHLAETGYIGLVWLILIISLTLLRCFKYRRLSLEVSISIFFFVAMFGASVLSNHHQYNYIFWFVLGCLWNTKYCENQIIKSRL